MSEFAALLAAQVARDPHMETVAIYDVARAGRPRPPRLRPSLLTAFIERLAFGTTECWHWVGSRSEIGYGMFASARDTYGCPEIVAHRIAWHLWNGPIPDGLKVLHRCDVRSCVRPEHLFLGTQADNVADMIAKGRDRRNPLRGERNHRSRLTDALVRAIRAEARAGAVTQRALAAKYGVSPMTVSRAVRGESWSHV